MCFCSKVAPYGGSNCVPIVSVVAPVNESGVCVSCNGVDVLSVDGTCPRCELLRTVGECASGNCSWCTLYNTCLGSGELCPSRCSEVSVHQCTRGVGVTGALSLYGRCRACCQNDCYCTGMNEGCYTTCSQVTTPTQCEGWQDVFWQQCHWTGGKCQSASGCFPLLGKHYNAQPYLLFVGSVAKDILTLVFLAATGERIAATAKRLKHRTSHSYASFCSVFCVALLPRSLPFRF